MGNIDTFGLYTRHRLEHWGEVFSLSRDCDYLGHQSKNMLQVLIEHKGEMPGKLTGYRPLEVDQLAMQVERIVSDMAINGQLVVACVLRAYYCGAGRRKVERWETANLLITTAGQKMISQRQYLTQHDVGVAQVRGVLTGMAMAA